MVMFRLKAKNKTFALLTCFLLTIVFVVIGRYTEAHLDSQFGFGSMKLPASSFLGIIQAMKSLICIIMVCVDYKKGSIISYVFLGGSIIFMIVSIITRGNMSSLPGIYNTIITMVSILIISNGFKKADRRAVTDYLTGLRNRRGMTQLLEKTIREKKPFHVVYFEIENFRTINDNLGHKYGDLALKSVADKLIEMENENTIYVSRIGGAEFAAVVFGNVDPRTFAERVMEKIGTSVTNVDEGFDISIALSVYSGIASFPGDADNTDDLLKFSDIAVYNAKHGNDKSRICFFTTDMKDSFYRQIELERIVKEALTREYFYMVYQPQYDIQNKKLRGFESLLRLRLPDGTNVSPGEFIPVAEKSELIMKIDSYVLKKAMRETKRMIELSGNTITVSVNVSAKNISSPGFVDEIKTILEATSFPAECLEIEITEYSFAGSRDITMENVVTLRKMGIQIALDDFGTGYTSLSQVMHLPINLLKIDKSLIDDIEYNQVNRDFVDAIIYMGHLMNCEVISEGVESKEQLKLLKDHECDYVQGFVWGKPMEYDNAVELCKKAAS